MKKINWEKIRIWIVVFIFLISGSGIIVRAVYLQVSDSNYSKFLKKKYKKQISRILTIKGERGNISDSKGNVLAITNKVESIYVSPPEIKEKEKVTKVFSALLNIDRKKILKKLNLKKDFAWIKRKVPRDITEKIKKFKFSGVHFLQEYKRYYPYGSVAANILGFCNIDGVGVEGLEYRYDKYLKGKSIKTKIYRDGKQKFSSVFDKAIYKNSKGDNVHLTLNFEIQSIVQEELKKWIELYSAKRGTAIVMEPDSGKILAMASVPTFNPNYYYKYPRKNYRNIAVSDNFEPGSTVKPLIVGWALSKKLIDLDWVYNCGNGYYRFKTLNVHDHIGMRWKTVEGIIVHSSNIGMVKIADYIGKTNIFRVYYDFGFGSYTGINISGESQGILPSLKKSSSITHATMAYGQGVAVTPIQLITAYSALINGGYLLKPFVVESITDSNGKIVKIFKREVLRKVIDENVSERMKKVLVEVVDKGTGRKTRLSYVKIGGKTGTAQVASSSSKGYLKGNYIASFIGFFPERNPKCLMLIIIENPKGKYYASDVACPCFKRVAEEIMPHIGINPNVKIAEKPKILKKLRKKSFKGLTKAEVLEELKKKKITNFRFIGSGFVEKKVKKGNRITFYFRES